MRDPRRHIRPVERPSGDSGELRLTKHWYERPFTRKVKALGTLAGAIGAIAVNTAAVGAWLGRKADGAIAPIVRREIAPVVAGQQASDRISSERLAAVKISIDTLTLEVRAIRAAIEKPKRKRAHTAPVAKEGANGEP